LSFDHKQPVYTSRANQTASSWWHSIVV